MTWVAWRQFRGNALVGAVAVAAIIVVLLVTRGHIADVAGTDAVTTWEQSLRLLGTALIGAPAFVGAFWGAPLLARELEAGTHRLAWTQSITRRRWYLTKLGVAGLVAVVAVGAFSLVFTWWSTPFDELGNRIGTANFGQRGVAPIAYALFALSLGSLAGAVLRRTLPAMGATLIGFFVVRFAFQLALRPHLIAPVTAILPNNAFGQREERATEMGGWVISSHTVDAAGRTIDGGSLDTLLATSCHLTRDSPTGDWVQCTEHLGIHDVARYHPADHFWALQLWESVIFVTLAGLLALTCGWWIRHRTT